MKRQIRLLLSSLSAIVLIACESNQIGYPNTKSIFVENTYHDVKIEDPYQWMEDNSAEDLKQWMLEQDKLYQTTIDENLKSKYLSSIKKYSQYSWHEPFRKFGKRFFYRVRSAGAKNEQVFTIENLNDQNPTLVFDPATELPEEDAQFLGIFEPDPKAKYLAFFYNLDGSEWQTLRIKDLTSGKLLDDNIKGLQMIGIYNNILWDKEGNGFYYLQFDPPSKGNEQPLGLNNPRVKYHTVGTSSGTDKIVFQIENSEKSIYFPRLSHDKNHLIVNVRDQNKSGYKVFIKNLNKTAPAQLILSDGTAKFFYVCNQGDRFLFNTNKDAPKNKVISLDIKQPSNWDEVIPEGELPIRAINFVGNRMVIKYVEDARQKLMVYSVDGKYKFDINFPKEGYIGLWPDAPSETFSFTVLVGPFFPAEIYKIDSHTGQTELVANGGANFDPSGYEFKQVFYNSKDGTQIPMFISYKRGLEIDGDNNAFLYAYGAYGNTPFPWYSPQMLAFMDNGGVYAHANIRGGGEYGEEWHQNGIKTNKQNGVDDYIGAAEWLIENMFTRKGQVVANGGSASGSLAATAGLQRPDIFGTVVINNPTLDMLRFSLFTGGEAKVPEFGDVDNKQEFDALLKYSPYHQLKEPQCFPSFFVQVGEKDETSVPMHGYKFVAALQKLQTCNNPTLLRIAWGAGHSSGTSPEESQIEAAEELAFIEQVLNK